MAKRPAPPLPGDIASLVTLRDARDIRIIGPDGAVRRSANQFGWDDRIELVESPTFFSLLGRQAA